MTLLTIHTREKLHPVDGEPRQTVEVRDGGQVLGELPVTRLVYEMLPQSLGKVTVEFIVEASQIETT